MDVLREICMSMEHISRYSPHEQQGRPLLKQEIVVYPRRDRMIRLAFWMVILLGAMLLNPIFGLFHPMIREFAGITLSAFVCGIPFLLWQFWRLLRNLR